MTIEIDGRAIGTGEPCFIIAEVGVNHNGDYETALKMVDAIADCGADCVKFQTFSAAEFVNNDDQIYEYVSQGQVVRESQLQMFTRLELDPSCFEGLFARARARGLIPLSTPTDRGAVDLLDRLGAGAFKVGSDDLVYTPFLKYVARKRKPMVISTGMADVDDIDRALKAIRGEGNEQVIVLHCVSLYPTPDERVNLRKITAMRERYNVPVGFSDHSSGVAAAMGAVCLGACVVEKHFTLDHDMPGPDHRFSLDPAELEALVTEIRRMEAMLGRPDLHPAPGEVDMRVEARRSVVAARHLPAGHILTAEDFGFQRPGSGIMPYDVDKLIGCRLAVDVAESTLMDWSHLAQDS